MNNIQIKILDGRIRTHLPAYASPASAGLDIHALLDAPLVLQAQQAHLVSTGIAIHLADPHYMAMLVPRSGLGHKYGITLGNGTGIIDADYQGELKVSLYNRSQHAYTIQPFDRIAQLIILPIARATWQEVESFAESERGEGGFGSTGVSFLSGCNYE